jgi:hypothetical protein
VVVVVVSSEVGLVRGRCESEENKCYLNQITSDSLVRAWNS